MTLDTEQDTADHRWEVFCADVHPSYDFWLREDGEFAEGPTRCFEVYVEQQAVWAEFCQRGAAPRLQFGIREASLLARVESETRRVAEASDTFQEYWLGPTVLAVRECASGRWTRVLVRPT